MLVSWNEFEVFSPFQRFEGKNRKKCFLKRFIYLFMTDTERERGRDRQREKQALRREPNVGLDPGS